MDSFIGMPASGVGGIPVMETRLNFASPGIDCFLGDSTYRVSDCEAKILCNGKPGQECTQFNGDAAQYTVYILKVAYCSETIPVETAYLEKFIESTGQWQQMGTYSAGGYNGWTWISWIIYPNHTTERWRIRWGNCTKEWRHVAVCQPNWRCEPGQTGWEIDGCGNKRLNPACNPPACIPSWQCEPGQTGWETDGCGNKRQNPACNPPSMGIISISSSPSGAKVYVDGGYVVSPTPMMIDVSPGSHTIKLTLTGYQDATQTVTVTAGQTTPVGFALTPVCTPSWVCEPGQTGLEIDGCGNKRQNPACAAVQPSGAGVYLAVAAVVTGIAAVAILSRRK